MTILIIAQQFFPDSVGGSARVAYEQARALAGRGHTVYIIAPKMDIRAHSKEMYEGMTIFRYGDGKRHVLGQSVEDVRRAPGLIKKVLAQHPCDVILAHQPTIAKAALSLNFSIPMVYLFHASVPREVSFQGLTGKGSWKKLFTHGFVAWLQKMEKEVVTRAVAIVVLSQYSHTLICSVYKDLPSAKIVRITTGVDSRVYAPALSKEGVRAQLGIPEDDVVLLTVRRLVPRMGLSQLIESCASIVRENTHVRLYIVGEGPLYESLEKQILREGLEGSVILTGRVRQDDVPLWYRAADAFVLSTRAYEGLGVATLEALASGVPVLGTPVGATPEILGNVDPRLLFEGTTPEDMRRGIEWFLYNGIRDVGLRNRARDLVVREYTWQRAGQQLEAVLLHVISRAPTATIPAALVNHKT